MDVLICSDCKSFNVTFDVKRNKVICNDCKKIMNDNKSKLDFHEYSNDKKKKEIDEIEKQTNVGNEIKIENNTFFTLYPKK
ncbi:MAG: hypothetical protein ACOC33_02020 [bacterium]